MAPLLGGPAAWFGALLALVVSVPVILGLVALLNRARDGSGADRAASAADLADLERRVEELESKLEHEE